MPDWRRLTEKRVPDWSGLLEGTEVLDIARDALTTLVFVSGPVMMTALVVGLTVALFQTVTQLQEMTLTFVPKIVAVFLALLVTLPYMGRLLGGLMERLMAQIIAGA